MSDDFFPFPDHTHRGKHYSDRHDSHNRHHDHDHGDNQHSFNRSNPNNYPYDRRNNDGYRDYHGRSRHDHFDLDRLMPMIEKITHSKTLMLFLILGAIAVLAVCIVLVVLFYPILIRIVEYVFGTGLKGIFDIIQSVLSTIGTGGGN